MLRRPVFWLLWFGLLSLCGCTKAPPRPSDEIFAEQQSLPRLYLTQEKHERVVAPANKGIFVDAASGEICWPALECTLENCPGRGAHGEPYLFIGPETGFFKQADGSLGYDPAKAQVNGEQVGACPACLQRRSPASETPAERQRFINAVRPYVLPESAAKLQALEEERIRRVEFEKHRP